MHDFSRGGGFLPRLAGRGIGVGGKIPPGVRRQAEMRLLAGSLRGEISVWLNLNWSGLASFRL